MPASDEDAHRAIRETAYFLWEREGRPHGRAEDHWLRAMARVATRHDDLTEDEERVLAGRPDANIPAMLTKDVPGG